MFHQKGRGHAANESLWRRFDTITVFSTFFISKKGSAVRNPVIQFKEKTRGEESRSR